MSTTTDSMINAATYNERAIEVASLLTEARMARAAERAPRTRDQLFPDYNRVGYGVAAEWEAMGSRPASEALTARCDELGFEFEHLGTTLGTVIHGIDLRMIDADQVAFIRATLLERKVIFFRDQHLSEDEQVAFGRCFGELDAFPFGASGENPFILQISHDAQRPGTENGWHTDVTWMTEPSLGSIAQLVTAPETGGDTLFADSHAAYLGLPTELAQRLAHLDGINDYRIFLGAADDELTDAIKAQIPFGVTHPLVRVHPETGKLALYLHGGFLRHDSLHDRRTGEQVEDSRRIIGRLLEEHKRPEYQCRFSWQVGSIAFWDNRAVQHYAASDYHPYDRVLRRVTVSGDRPYGVDAPQAERR
ncbi:MAG: TauD/TfdA family dioxygenase [Actinomycetota bacterium]